MVRLREIPRTAAFAWSSGPAKPLLVTGTRAGAVDDSFSDEVKLELWDLNLDDQEQGLELQPIASIAADSKFHDLAWGPPDETHPRGIIAGGLENGSLYLWDAEKLIAGESDAQIAHTTKHSGAIKSLQFNPLKSQILATAGDKGELWIHDINDIENPLRLGNAAARSDDIECVAWNRKVSHILATGGSGGFVTVWDLKTKKASLTLNNNRKRVSAIAWDPQNSTKLLTATPDDNTPLILLWDLRNSNAPERTLQGHDQGVLSLSWCEQDSDLLISSGKDNRTVVWNPQTGERYGEFPEVTNWTFLTKFNPHNPNLSATASFDGKIAIQTLQNTNSSTTQTAAQNNLDGEDFFTSAQTQPQGASFSLPKAPTWMQRPIGASFGFGGKVIVFKKNPTAAGQPRSSRLLISQFSVDSEVTAEAEKFESVVQSGDLKQICQSHLEQAKTDEEKADWLVMETLVADEPRQQVISYLGFSKEEETADGEAESTQKEAGSETPKENGAKKSAHKRMTSIFDGADGDDFISHLAANKGAKTEDPFHLLSEGNTALEDLVTKSLMLGNFAKAAEICLKEDRMADAFIIANCGGKELVDKVQAAYLSKREGSPSYLRLLSSVLAGNLWDIVYNADLADWKETMATLCTYAKPNEFPDLCEALGDRILEHGSRKDASFCYLVGSKLEKVVSIWIEELGETEQAGMKEPSEDSTFSVHARSLQQFIEKVTIFRHVTKFQDSETGLSSDWKLAALYDKYTEYADIVAAHGLLSVAQKYLDLLPKEYPAADVARNRVKLATQKASAQVAARQPATATRASSRAQPVGYPAPAAPSGNIYAPPAPVQAPAQTPAANSYAPPSTANPYAPPGATPVANPYAPPANPYAPSPSTTFGQPQQGYTPPQPSGFTPFTPYGQPAIAPPPMAGPPRGSTPASNPSLLRAKDVGDWNDVPMVTKVPPRKSTPRAAITSPFPGQQPAAGIPPPPQSPYGAPPRASPTPPPPPPKAGQSGPPRVTSPLAGPPHASQMPMRPLSTTSNAYAPPPPAGAPTAPRTASPYNSPPSGPPTANRYAPAPTAQQPAQPPAASMPPAASRPPPPNPYATSVGTPGAPGQYAPSPYAQAATPVGQLPLAPPPSAGPPPAATMATPPPPRATASPAAAPPKAKHPPGDRSHIPASAQPLVDILSRDMQRVASKAPQNFAPQVKDTQKRLGLLFDHLNNEELVKPETVAQLAQLAEALEARDYGEAHRIQTDIHASKPEECGNWMVGVKRLISMSKATP
ncbi:Protein transport protein SEC31 [Cytospora mali]|uniref:Protein transport protein SEC31 n=1 Tax=Cytospora mali TaxID=578113 RepID=A0A194VUE4_CYTMA|nr:Protein transport protein SEC31 [Valsa mali]